MRQLIVPLSRIDAVIEAIASVAFPVLVPVAGGSCSGKSFLARVLVSKLQEVWASASIMPLDDYSRDGDDPELPRTADGRRLFDRPESYHIGEYRNDVRKLLGRATVQIPIYDKRESRRVAGRRLAVPPADVVIAEGLYPIDVLAGLHPRTVNVYVEAAEGIRMERRIARDTAAYGVNPQKVRDVMRAKVLPYHAQCVVPQKAWADIVVVNEVAV